MAAIGPPVPADHQDVGLDDLGLRRGFEGAHGRVSRQRNGGARGVAERSDRGSGGSALGSVARDGGPRRRGRAVGPGKDPAGMAIAEGDVHGVAAHRLDRRDGDAAAGFGKAVLDAVARAPRAAAGAAAGARRQRRGEASRHSRRRRARRVDSVAASGIASGSNGGGLEARSSGLPCAPPLMTSSEKPRRDRSDSN